MSHLRNRFLALALALVLLGACLAGPVFAAGVTFSDVLPGSWYEEAVSWGVQNGVVNGMGHNKFMPDRECTRAQIVTMIWRAAGSPRSDNYKMSYTDVPKGSWYYDAVLWADYERITQGMTKTEFWPDYHCTRGQIVTFIYRIAGRPPQNTVTSPFTDVRSNAYYAKPVAWATEIGIAQGMTSRTFAPDDVCTRAQAVTFLYRYCSVYPILMFGEGPSVDDYAMVSKINASRAEYGLPKLSFNMQYWPCAVRRAQEQMVSFGHVRPNGSSWETIVYDFGLPQTNWRGENVQKANYTTFTVDASHTAFMNSASHRANILSTNYTSVSVCVLREDGGTFIAVLFWG